MCVIIFFFFFKQKTAYEIGTGDWSSDVCSSDLDFSQNQRPKVFSEKIAIFPRRVPVENIKFLKAWLWVFSATDILKNLKLHYMDYNPNMSLWDNFRQNRRPKVFSEKIANFLWHGPGKNCRTLKTWLWVFSATDILRNLKLHHIDYDPNLRDRKSVV